MRKPFVALALALAVATAGVAAWAGNVSRPLGVPIASHDRTVITPPGGSQPTTAAALGEITTTEGTWTFGTPGDANGDYPLLLNGSAAGGGHAAVFVGRHLDSRRPLGYLDGEVMAGLRGHPGPARLDDDAPRVRPEPEIAGVFSHGPTVRGQAGKGPLLGPVR